MTQSQSDPRLRQVAGKWRLFASRTVAIGGWVALAAAIVVWIALHGGDLWWPSTVLMFGPHWLLVVFPVILLPASLILHRRALRTVLPAIVIAVGPVMGFCVPWGSLDGKLRSGEYPLRVLCCNMHDAKTDWARLDALIDTTMPDVVALQQSGDRLVSGVLAGGQWHTHEAPGMFLASRYPIRNVEAIGNSSTDDHGLVTRYDLETPAGVVAVFNLHFATPREGLSALAHGNIAGVAAVNANSELRFAQSMWVAEASRRLDGPVLLMGDFNSPPSSAIFREVWEGYSDAFASAGWGWGHTFFTRVGGVRIDHILVGGGVRPIKCWVGPNIGSPHRPVLADVAWGSAGLVR